MPLETFPDEAIVVRGGVVTAAQLRNGAADHVEHPGIHGFSVQSEAGMTWDDLARAGEYPHKMISITTVQEIRDAGYDLVRTNGRGVHATVVVPRDWTEADARTLAAIFEVNSNPAPRKL